MTLRFPSRSLILIASAALLSACGNSNNQNAVAAPSQTASSPSVSTATSTTAEASSPEDAQLALGKKAYVKCKACHTLGEGERHRIGPNLHGVAGGKIASKDGFAYSKAFQASDVIWTDENLNAYLERPKDFIPGNRMTFAGIKKEDERKAVIAYIKNSSK